MLSWDSGHTSVQSWSFWIPWKHLCGFRLMGAGSAIRKICGWGWAWDQLLLLTTKSIFQRLKKEGEEVSKESMSKFCWLGTFRGNCSWIFLGFVSKLNIARKGTVSIHGTARHVGVSFVKEVDRLPCGAAPHTGVCLDIDGSVPSLPILLGAELVAGAWGEELCLLKPPYGLSAISYSDCTDLLWLARWGPWSPPGSWGSQMGAEVPAARCSSRRAAPALLCWDAEPAWDWAGDRSGARGFPGWHSLKKKVSPNLTIFTYSREVFK